MINLNAKVLLFVGLIFISCKPENDEQDLYMLLLNDRDLFQEAKRNSAIIGKCKKGEILPMRGENVLVKEDSSKRNFLYDPTICESKDGYLLFDKDLEYGTFEFLMENKGTYFLLYEFDKTMLGNYKLGKLYIELGGYDSTELFTYVGLSTYPVRLGHYSLKKLGGYKYELTNEKNKFIVSREKDFIFIKVLYGDENLLPFNGLRLQKYEIKYDQ